MLAALLGTTAVTQASPFGTPVPGAQPGRVLQVAQAAPAAIGPYIWSATKGSDGAVDLAGFLPSQDVRDMLADGISKLGTDTTALASGEPDGFTQDAVAALDVLGALDSGKASFDGGTWSITGAVDSAEKAATAQQAFDASPLKSLGAAYEVDGPSAAAAAPDVTTLPAPSTTSDAAKEDEPDKASAAASSGSASAAADATAATTPAVSPNYAWSAEKAGDGTITFNGTVPSDRLKSFLLSHAGSHTLDNSTVADGAPKDFVGGALYGLDALMTLESGKLLYAGGTWSLAGIAKDPAAEKAARSAVSVIDTKAWKFDIKAPVASTAAAPAAEAPATEAPAAETPAAKVPAAEAPAAAAAAPAATNDTAAGTASNASAAPATPATETPAAAANSKEAAATGAGNETAPAPASGGDTAPAAAGEATSAPAVQPAEPYAFSASKRDDGTIALTGQVPTEGAKGYFGDIAGNVPTADLKVVPNAPDNFIIDALAGLDALGQLKDGQVGFDGKSWTLKGKAATPEIGKAVADRLAALPTGKDWTTNIAGPSPIEVCTESVASFTAANKITFDSRTRLSKGTDAMLDALAADLAACPAARVDVEGHTDSDGDASANMALSVARAEAVISELVKRGIKADRLYAVGYGETLPIVANSSKANKAKNRRIEFKIEDAAAK